MPELFIELFSEEIPARMQAPGADALRRAVTEALAPLAGGPMPSYTIYARPETFTGAQRAALARSVTAVHSEQTGAPRSFVQTIFLPVEPDAHFVGAEPAIPAASGSTGTFAADARPRSGPP